MSDFYKLVRIFSFLSRELVAGARKKGVAKFSDSLHDLNFILTNIIPSSPKVKATSTTPATPAVKQQIDLYMIDDVKFAKLIAGEAHKFFLASMISLERSRQFQQHNIAWQVVEHYYAAYYAVHYLMRVAGYSLTNIDDAAIKAMMRSNVAGSTSVQSGLSTMLFSDDCVFVTLTKNEKGGGSHKEAWAIWVTILTELIDQCKSDDIEYSSLEIELKQHMSFVKINDQKFNPSEIRAEVNYQFKGQSWCFEDDTNGKIATIQSSIADDSFSLTGTDDKILKLINNNKLIINLARDFFKKSNDEYSQGICRSLRNQFRSKISTLP